MGPILRKLPFWRQMITFLITMMIAFSHSHQLKILIRKGLNNIAMVLGTDETVIFDTENNLDLKENEEVLHDDDGEDGKTSKRNVNFSQLLVKK